MNILFDLVASCAIASVLFLVYLRRHGTRFSKPALPLPPGPKKYPLLGNALQLPKRNAWETYREWSHEYKSDIIHLDAAGTSILVLNSANVVNDLLEKRSSIYSSRASLPMVDLTCWNWNLGFKPYGDAWRAQRKIFHHRFHPKAALRYRPQEVEATSELLRRFLDAPNDFMEHIQHMAGEVIMSIGYGIKVQSQNDPYIKVAEIGNAGLHQVAMPGSFLIEKIPALKYIPSWFPGAGFKRKAAEWKKAVADMTDIPFNLTKKDFIKGIAPPSFVSLCLEDIKDGEDEEEQETVIKRTALAIYSAGTDTTVTVLAWFMMAVVLHPEVQLAAQKELDAVIGTDRLPDFSDELSLPYISAIVKEVLRWRPVAPLAVPHFLTADDTYGGYHLPANSVVLPNAWAILHDESTYPNPSKFDPSRYLRAEDGKLDPSVRDPGLAAFGFGRRICPGRFMALSSVWIAIASILAVFDISKALDENGQPIEVDPEDCEQGLVAHPLPFKCTIRPRSKIAESVIRASKCPIL